MQTYETLTNFRNRAACASFSKSLGIWLHQLPVDPAAMCSKGDKYLAVAGTPAQLLNYRKLLEWSRCSSYAVEQSVSYQGKQLSTDVKGILIFHYSLTFLLNKLRKSLAYRCEH
ncbi:hypothetical protein BaRGS_00034966 [Batillaria attramentaria]|uniref:Uncharacterized protein n=1 Tax=Batillaria attramentaria TaxID=370345 RepID=A0ABD0JFS3_9CAEN